MYLGFKAEGTVFQVTYLLKKSREVTHSASPFIVAQRPSKGRRGSGAMMLHPELLVKTSSRALASKARAGASTPGMLITP
jgi:isochorismate synthase EntC